MYKVDLLPQDRKEMAKILRKQAIEEMRKPRIFDANRRMFGLDLEGLNFQRQERNQRDDLERQREYNFHVIAKKNDQLVRILDNRIDKARKDVFKSLEEFRKVNQRFENRREYDLNKKKYLGDSPIRFADDDPRLGISSAQVFVGEDLNKKERDQIQVNQQEAWLRGQMEEKKRRDAEELRQRLAFEEKYRQRGEIAANIEKAEKAARAELERVNKEFNEQLAKEKKYQDQRKKQEDEAARAAHVINMITSDLLTENPAAAESSFGHGRVLTNRWKGMSNEEKALINRENAEVMMERKLRKEEERREEEAYHKYMQQKIRASKLVEKRVETMHKDHEQAMHRDNARLAESQKDMKTYFDKVVYTNKPTAAYYEQFNTTTR